MTARLRTLLLTTALTLPAAFVLPAAAGEPSASPLVSSAWLKAHLDDASVHVLDIRSAISKSSRATFEQGHVPGAIYSNYLTDGWRTTNSDGTPGVLPPVDQLETLFSRLGIEEDGHVVIVSAGLTALDTSAATRVYWTLKVAGHERVSILDGGFAGWRAQPGFPLGTGATEAEPSFYEVTLNADLIASSDDVADALSAGETVIDNRPAIQFAGKEKHKASKRYGTLPGAMNIPESRMTVKGSGFFEDRAALEALHAQSGVGPGEPLINFCNTGHWASLGWFVAHEILGHDTARLYDGSLVEWSADPTLPMTGKNGSQSVSGLALPDASAAPTQSKSGS